MIYLLRQWCYLEQLNSVRNKLLQALANRAIDYSLVYIATYPKWPPPYPSDQEKLTSVQFFFSLFFFFNCWVLLCYEGQELFFSFVSLEEALCPLSFVETG